ncbi:hypothetical protein EVAR_14075_1 [Eumeta japonica]|uniref:Uncharacterized protein n=1 Tax=Eumeta variegata TaxID=151549 RepID=A0A4C1UPK5_EUMVA|nr:hypothetical protein EVAR_14075_1 [Eumeta japonica]
MKRRGLHTCPSRRRCTRPGHSGAGAADASSAKRTARVRARLGRARSRHLSGGTIPLIHILIYPCVKNEQSGRGTLKRDRLKVSNVSEPINFAIPEGKIKVAKTVRRRSRREACEENAPGASKRATRAHAAHGPCARLTCSWSGREGLAPGSDRVVAGAHRHRSACQSLSSTNGSGARHPPKQGIEAPSKGPTL